MGKKIKDTRIAGKLPDKKKGLSGIELYAVIQYRQKLNNTELSLEDIVEVDVGIVRDTIDDCYDVDNGIPNWEQVAQAIAKSGCIRWKGEK